MLLLIAESTLIMQIRVYVNTCHTVCLQHQTWPSSKLFYPIQSRSINFKCFCMCSLLLKCYFTTQTLC